MSLPIKGLPRRRVGIALRRGRPSAPTRAVLELLDSMTVEVTRQLGVHTPELPEPAAAAVGESAGAAG